MADYYLKEIDKAITPDPDQTMGIPELENLLQIRLPIFDDNKNTYCLE